MCSIRYCNTFNIFSFILKTFKTKKGMLIHFKRKHEPKYVFSSFLNSIMAMGLNVVSSGAYRKLGKTKGPIPPMSIGKSQTLQKRFVPPQTFSAKPMNIMIYYKKWSTTKRSKPKEEWPSISRKNTIQSMCFLVSSIRSWV